MGIEIGDLERLGRNIGEKNGIGKLLFGESDGKGETKATGAGTNVGDDRMGDLMVFNMLKSQGNNFFGLETRNEGV